MEPRTQIYDDGWRGGFPNCLAECAKSRLVHETTPESECVVTHESSGSAIKTLSSSILTFIKKNGSWHTPTNYATII